MNSLNCCVMSCLSLLCGFILLGILLEGGQTIWHSSRKDRGFYKSLYEAKLSMQQSLKFINQANASIVYSPQLESFYEFTNWKRFPESTYRGEREGDYGEVNEYRTNTRFINAKEGFNTIFNRALSLDRIVPDYRPKGCKHWHYKPGILPKVSVIIALTAEHELILARTITSILLTTPRDLLKEIILVYHRAEDKGHSPAITKNEIMKKLRDIILTENAKLLAHFDNVTIAQMPFMFGEVFSDSLIRVLFTGKSIGLGASLNMGASEATGDVFVFLKSRIELHHNWLQPLLAPIVDDYRTVSIPGMLAILPSSFKFEQPYNDDFLLTFWNWGLQTQHYEMDIMENKSNTEKYEHIQALPYQLDLVTSSQFAISKKFFEQLGSFDPHYLILEEVNLDLSFKVRTFGGRVMTTRCSNVFTLQKTTGPDPITAIFDEVYIANNYTFEPKCFLKTLANRWIGNEGGEEEGGGVDGLNYFHLIHPTLTDQFCSGINNRYDDEHLKTALVEVNSTEEVSGPANWLGNFQYRIIEGNLMQSVQTDSFLATLPAENDYTGFLRNAAFSVCLHVEGDKVETAYCRETPTAAVLRLDSSGALRFGSVCFRRAEKKVKEQVEQVYSLESVSCFFDLPLEAQGWQYALQGGRMRYLNSYCLSYRDAIGIVLAQCSEDDDDVSQQWEWTLLKYSL